MPDNAQVVREFLARINERDLDGALQALAPDARLDWSGSEAPDRGIFHGREEWMKWMAGREADMPHTRFELRELIDAPPDAVVTVGLSRGRGRASGVEIEALAAAVWRLRDGQVTRLTLYQGRDQALEAVGVAR